MLDKLRKVNILIAILGGLLAVGLTALAVIYFSGKDSLAVAPDNYIAPQGEAPLNAYGFSSLSASMPLRSIITSARAKETVISIYKNHAEDSAPFKCPNMFPGDSESKNYLVEVSHKGTVTVCFHADIRAGYEKLAEVLKCRVQIKGEKSPLYDGLMRDMPASLNHRISSIFKKTTDLTYIITVYLDTKVGNDYMNRELVADFRWWVEESGGDTPPVTTSKPEVTTAPEVTTKPEVTTAPEVTTKPEVTTAPEVTTEPEITTEEETTEDPEDTGELVNPETGDSFRFFLWIILAPIALLISREISKKSRREYSEEASNEK